MSPIQEWDLVSAILHFNVVNFYNGFLLCDKSVSQYMINQRCPDNIKTIVFLLYWIWIHFYIRPGAIDFSFRVRSLLFLAVKNKV